MAINLGDIRQAVEAYMGTQVSVSVSDLGLNGGSLNPGETFGFSITAANAAGDARPGDGAGASRHHASAR